MAEAIGRARSPSAPRPPLPQRKSLPHAVPLWVGPDAVFFITLCALPRRANHFCRTDVAERLWESARYRHTLGLWWLHLFLLMPDHLHALLSFPGTSDMRHTVTAWKRYMARHFGIPWQRDFFDHRLRRDESFDEKATYIRLNRVRAGLIERPDDWPFVWGFDVSGQPIGRALW